MGLNHSAASQADFRFLVACFAHLGLRHRDIPWPVQRTEYQLICARGIWITRSFWRSGPNCPKTPMTHNRKKMRSFIGPF